MSDQYREIENKRMNSVDARAVIVEEEIVQKNAHHPLVL